MAAHGWSAPRRARPLIEAPILEGNLASVKPGRPPLPRPARLAWLVSVPVAVVLVVYLALRVGSGPGPTTNPPPALSVGHFGPAKSFRLPGLTGGAGVVGPGDAGLPMLINFWASWCTPCRAEMPMLAGAARRLSGRVGFIGVDENDDRAGALGLMRRAETRYPVGFDPTGSLAGPYGLVGLPTTVFVAPDGQVVARALGPLTAGTLNADLARLGWSAP